MFGLSLFICPTHWHLEISADLAVLHRLTEKEDHAKIGWVIFSPEKYG